MSTRVGTLCVWRISRKQVLSLDQRVVQCVLEVIDEFNEEFPSGLKLGKSMDTALYGPSGQLDSLHLVQLIVSLEQKLEDEFEMTVTLADERALSQRRSPFATVGSLSEYAQRLIEGTPGDVD